MSAKDEKTMQQAQKVEYACAFCGNVFYSYETTGAICSFCHQFTESSSKELESDPFFIELRDANASISQMKEIDLAEITSKAVAKNDPRYLYGAAMLNLRLSDIKHRNKNYRLGGFMEENAKEEEEAHSLYSTAKALLFDTIDLCKKNEASDPKLYYLEFISRASLNDLHGMGVSIEMVRKNEKERNAAEFAEMLYAIASNDKRAEEYIKNVISLGEIAAYLELGRFYAKEGKLREAKKVLSQLASNGIAMPSSQILFEKVNKLLED